MVVLFNWAFGAIVLLALLQLALDVGLLVGLLIHGGIVSAPDGVRYGLAAYIWTNNLERALTFSQNVEAGMVWLNSHNVRDLRTPFGGVKASGLGHEGGYRSIDFYTDQQAVHITLGDVHTPRFGAA